MSAIIGDLYQSSQGRSGTPDGNVFFDITNGKLEFFLDSEVASLSAHGGIANPLTDANRPTLAVLYAFERQQRKADETLRQFDYFLEGNYKRAGSYIFVNGRTFGDAVLDEKNVDASGWSEFDTSGQKQRMFFGAISLGNIEASSQPYYALPDGVPVNFSRSGPVSESVLVWQYNGGSEIDNTGAFTISVRTFGNSFSSKSLVDLPFDTTDADIGGFAITETNKDNIFQTLSDVYGDEAHTGEITPYNTMELIKLTTGETRTGFTGADKDFTYVLETSGATVQQVMAKLDAFAQTDDDINPAANTPSEGTRDNVVIRGKRNSEWYTTNSSGQMVTKAGLFVRNLPSSELKNIIQTSDDVTACSYPSLPSITILTGSAAQADSNAWYHVYYKDGAGDLDFNKANAVTVNDKDGNPVKGLVAGGDISFQYAYSSNTQAGLVGGIDKDIIVEVEGDGGCTAAKTEATIVDGDISITCSPGVENNI